MRKRKFSGSDSFLTIGREILRQSNPPSETAMITPVVPPKNREIIQLDATLRPTRENWQRKK
jgi:hypothetical protein